MLRRSLVKALGLAPVAAAQSPGLEPQRQRKYDILIKNGEVTDPSRQIRQRADLGIADGKIAAIEPAIPAETGLVRAFVFLGVLGALGEKMVF